MKKLRNYIFILSISIFVGLVALFIVYLLPTDRMEANVRSSIDIFIRKAFIHSRQRDINLPSSTTKPMRSCYWTPSILPKTVLRSKMRCVFPELRCRAEIGRAHV